MTRDIRLRFDMNNLDPVERDIYRRLRREVGMARNDANLVMVGIVTARRGGDLRDAITIRRPR